MTIGLTYPELLTLKPCTDSLQRVCTLLSDARTLNGETVTAQIARDAGCTFDDVLWAASALARSNPDVERRMRLWLADCAARVLHLYERKYPADERARQAIVLARQFAHGETTTAARAAASAAAWDAAWAAASADALAAANAAARAAAWAAARAAARSAAWDAARSAARAAARDAAWAAARDAEQEWQYAHLVARLSDPEPDDVPLPEQPHSQEMAA